MSLPSTLVIDERTVFGLLAAVVVLLIAYAASLGLLPTSTGIKLRILFIWHSFDALVGHHFSVILVFSPFYQKQEIFCLPSFSILTQDIYLTCKNMREMEAPIKTIFRKTLADSEIKRYISSSRVHSFTIASSPTRPFPTLATTHILPA